LTVIYVIIVSPVRCQIQAGNSTTEDWCDDCCCQTWSGSRK